jgi:hypothetical protein
MGERVRIQGSFCKFHNIQPGYPMGLEACKEQKGQQTHMISSSNISTE